MLRCTKSTCLAVAIAGNGIIPVCVAAEVIAVKLQQARSQGWLGVRSNPQHSESDVRNLYAYALTHAQMMECRPYRHRWNARVWTSRQNGAHYGSETATSPEICRLLFAKLWLRSNYLGRNCYSAANLAKRNCGSLPVEMRENAGDCYFVGHAHNFVNINA